MTDGVNATPDMAPANPMNVSDYIFIGPAPNPPHCFREVKAVYSLFGYLCEL